ncbi:MAG: hypothetical protein ACI8W8_000015 [Rhodothermales bacterium]|jgi:hypothetical protein
MGASLASQEYSMISSTRLLATVLLISLGINALAQQGRRGPRPNREAALVEAFKGVFYNGQTPDKDLFPITQTGVSTEPVRLAALDFLSTLSSTQRKSTVFPVNDIEWRKWDNRHSYTRQGMGFEDMTQAQRNRAFGLLRASLSARGLKQSKDIMKLNGTLEELVQRPGYGEWLYWITVMGEPSADKPWGWQIDGHHLVINYFVLGDQVVMSPVFMGSEPITAKSGKFAGTVVCQEEQGGGLAMINTLDEVQRAKAIVKSTKDGTNNVGEAFRDNQNLDLIGIRASELKPVQRTQLLKLIAIYIGHMRDPHAKVKMKDVFAHLDDTYFGWMGGTEADSVFYYRIQSPVLLIEFDHQRPIALARSQTPTRDHIHTVIRTPNGNDYGKDLLRQHHLQHSHE